MTAKTAACAIAACTSLALAGGCGPKHTEFAGARPGAMDPLLGAQARLVAGDALGVDLHCAATSTWMLAEAR